MLKEGDKHRLGWGRRWEKVRDAHAKAQVLGGGWWVGDGGACGTGFFFLSLFEQGENARRRPGPSAQDPRKMETLRWVRWCRTMVQNHHRGGRNGWWVVNCIIPGVGERWTKSCCV